MHILWKISGKAIFFNNTFPLFTKKHTQVGLFVDVCLFPFSLWFSSPREVSLSATTDSLQPGEKRVQTEDRRMLVCGSLLSQHFLSSFSLLRVSLQPLNLTSPYLTTVYGIVRGERTGDRSSASEGSHWFGLWVALNTAVVQTLTVLHSLKPVYFLTASRCPHVMKKRWKVG